MITKDLPISEIKIQENIRQKNVMESIPELMQSIKDNGLLQPIGVKENHAGYLLIWGFRRLSACKKLGWKSIPAVIFAEKDDELSEEEFFILNATENLQRRQNTLLEFGRVCKILRKTLSTSEIAKRLSVPKSRVEGALVEISRVPKKWQKRIRIMEGEKEKAGDIPMTTASAIASLRGVSNEQKDKLLEHVSVNEANKEQIVAMASLMKGGLSFTEARNKIDDYKSVSFKILVNRKKYDELKKEYDTEVEFFMKALNTFAKDDRFCFKIAEKHDKVTNEEILKGLARLKENLKK
jgi:ParB family chromosome partitioning protein